MDRFSAKGHLTLHERVVERIHREDRIAGEGLVRSAGGCPRPLTMRFPVPLSTLRFVRSTEAWRRAKLPSPLYAARLAGLRVNCGATPETSER
jgi:hypothetical protein